MNPYRHSSLHIAAVFASIATLCAAQDPCGEWRILPTPIPPEAEAAQLEAVTVASPSDAWAVGSWTDTVGGNRLEYSLAMHWNGSDWTITPSPNPTECNQCTSVGLLAVEGASADDVWSGGSARVRGVDGFIGYHALLTHWDGQGWSVVNTPPAIPGGSGDEIRDIEVIAQDDVWFVGDWLTDDEGFILHTALAMHWNGSSFEVLDVPIVNPERLELSGNDIHAISAVSSDDVWMVGHTNILAQNAADYSQIHHWDGTRWEHVPGPTPGQWNKLNDVIALASDDVWAIGEYFDGDYNVFAIHWDGREWTLDNRVPGAGFTIEAFAPDDIYTASDAIWHFDGAIAQIVEDWSNSGLDSPRVLSIESAGSCETMFAAGFSFLGGEQQPFTARLVSSGFSLALEQSELIHGQSATFTVSGARGGERVHYLYSFAGTGSGPCPPLLGGLCLDLLNPIVHFGSALADGSGVATLSVTVPENAPRRQVHTQAAIRRGPGGADSVKSNTVSDTIR